MSEPQHVFIRMRRHTAEKPQLRVAVHEVGHAVVHLWGIEHAPRPSWMTRYRVREVSVVPETEEDGSPLAGVVRFAWIPFDQEKDGDRTGFINPADKELQQSLWAEALGTAAGPAAELQYRGSISGIPIFRGQRIAGLMSADRTPLLRVDDAVSIAQTMSLARDAFDFPDGTDWGAVISKLMLAAWRHVVIEWPGIMDAALVMRERRTVSGDEFAEIWSQCRRSDDQRATREARLLRQGKIPPPIEPWSGVKLAA